MAEDDRADRILRAFGKRLRACRIAAGYNTADSFARELGIDGWRYRKYERGESMPPFDVLEDICRLTDKSADFLLFGVSRR